MPSSDADASQGFDIPVRPSREPQLSQERKTSIEHALQKYRERVLQLNLRALELAIQDIEKQQLDPEDGLESLEEDDGIRLDPPDPTITIARDFLSEDRRENLIRTCRLDGTKHGEVNVVGRHKWIENTEGKILTDQRIHNVMRPNGLPADLKYLMTLVLGLCGPGLPRYRYYGELHQLKFLSGLDDGDGEEDEKKTESGYVAVPQTAEEAGRGERGDGILEDWGGTNYKVSLAVCIGAGGFAVYCRDRDEDKDKYRWRYALLDPKDAMETDLYDTIEDFLEFYAEFNKQGEEEEDVT